MIGRFVIYGKRRRRLYSTGCLIKDGLLFMATCEYCGLFSWLVLVLRTEEKNTIPPSFGWVVWESYVSKKEGGHWLGIHWFLGFRAVWGRSVGGSRSTLKKLLHRAYLKVRLLFQRAPSLPSQPNAPLENIRTTPAKQQSLEIIIITRHMQQQKTSKISSPMQGV